MIYDDYQDEADIGYCTRCGADMTNEPEAAIWCTDCSIAAAP